MESSENTLYRSKQRTKRIQWSALAGIAKSGAVACVTVFSAPLAINYLGKDLYGIWVIITAFYVWAQIFDFGILNGLTNTLSEAFGRDDYPAAQRYICTAFLISAGVGIVGAIFWSYASLHIPWGKFIKVSSEEQGWILARGVSIAGAIFLISLPFLLITRILQASQRLYIGHFINFVAYVLSLIALIFGIYCQFGILKLFFVVNVLPVVWYVGCWFYWINKTPWARFSWKYVDRLALKRVAYSSIPLLVYQLINLIISQIIPILLGMITTLRDVADFNILWKIYLFIFLMLSSIALAHGPGIRDAFERKEFEWIKKSLKRLIGIQIALIIAGCSLLPFIGNLIILTWIRMPLEQLLDTQSWLIYIFFILFAVLNATVNSVLLILDRVVLQIALASSSGAILVLGIFWCVPKMGLISIFAIIGMTSFLSFMVSLHAIRKLLRRVALKAPAA